MVISIQPPGYRATAAVELDEENCSAWFDFVVGDILWKCSWSWCSDISGKLHQLQKFLLCFPYFYHPFTFSMRSLPPIPYISHHFRYLYCMTQLEWNLKPLVFFFFFFFYFYCYIVVVIFCSISCAKNKNFYHAYEFSLTVDHCVFLNYFRKQ